MARYDEYLEFLNHYVTESQAATFTEATLATPVGKANNLAMIIHQIDVKHPIGADAVADKDEYRAQVCSASQSAIGEINNPNVLMQDRVCYRLVTSGMTYENLVQSKKFDPPLLYAKSQLWLGVQTIGQGAATTYYIRICYTIRKVNLIKMVEALTD